MHFVNLLDIHALMKHVSISTRDCHMCGSPGYKSNINPLCILTTLPLSKRCSAVLPLRVGLVSLHSAY